MSNHTLFIVNPVSARGTTAQLWQQARQDLNRLGLSFDEYLTKAPGEAACVTRRALQSGINCIVAVGGDGTLNEVLNGYLNYDGCALNPAATIGLLPSGTGSDLRRSVGLMNYADALRAITGRHTRLLDAMRVSFQNERGDTVSRYGFNVVTFGLGGEAVALVNRWRTQWPRWIGGRIRFTAAALLALGRYRNVAVRVLADGEREYQLSTDLIVIANGRFAGGGMMVAPHAEPDDGWLDVILTDQATRLDVIKELPRIQHGSYLANPRVTETRARTISVSSAEPLRMEFDGEPAGLTPVEVTVLPGCVRFLCSRQQE
ncbi:MAG TPA: diacylglycerol kinase family protein [Blastocatellia bacterium]|nr:diacylglycerol kinase family protein [Blastocatellia bacterium]